MGRFFSTLIVVIMPMSAMISGCAHREVVIISPRPLFEAKPQQVIDESSGASLASFSDELAISLEPSKLEDETTATEVFIFNRGSRTWVIALDADDETGQRSLEFDVHDPSQPDQPLPPAAIGITKQCPRAPSHDVHVIGPGERDLVACVEKLVDLRNVDEIELEADLRFKAMDGSEIHVHSPPFRVARRPVSPARVSAKQH